MCFNTSINSDTELFGIAGTQTSADGSFSWWGFLSRPHVARRVAYIRRIKALGNDRGKPCMVWWHLRLGHDVGDRKNLPRMKQSPGSWPHN